MELLDLSFCRPFRLAAKGKTIDHAFDSLALPCSDLVRVQLMLRCYLLDSLVAALRFQRDLGLKLVCKLPALLHSRIPQRFRINRLGQLTGFPRPLQSKLGRTGSLTDADARASNHYFSKCR